MATKTAILHVMQASYGDALILEFNETGTGDTTYMLIDGGPGSTEPMYTTGVQARVRFNLFYTLNRLSGSTLASGTTPPANVMKKIDTLILTHDDVDHKQGIGALFASVLKLTKISKHKTDLYNTWVLGDAEMKAKKKPIEHIWYNSLKAITTLRNGDAGVKVKDGWFDLQLADYSKKVPPAIEFNSDFAASTDPAGRSGNFAMLNAKSATGGGLIKKGQFTLQFLGPLWDVLEHDTLLKMLQAPNSLNTPKYKFDKQVLGKASTTALSKGTLDEFERLGQDEELEIKVDSSLKNRSSIAFIAEDGPTRILLLGDAIADILKPLYTGTPVDFTLMKVMHHGSSFNNYWVRNAARKAEEKTIPVIKNNKFDVATLAYIYFFAKIRAKKYVISASLDVHPNPHVATVIGIIAAAIENEKNVEIYLTNVLAPDVLHTIGERFIKGTETVIPYVAINLLAQGSHSGSVAIYEGEKDGSEWVSYIARDLRTSYPSNMKTLNPRIAKRVNETKDFHFEPYVKKLKPSPPLVPTPGPGSTPTPGLSPAPPPATPAPGGTPGTASSVATPAPAPMFMAMTMMSDTPIVADIPFFTSTPTPLPAVPRASPPANSISTKLIGVSTVPSHEELATYQPYNTKALSNFDEVLQYLISQNDFTAQDMEDAKADIVRGDGLKLGIFAALFMGVERSEEFLAAIPFDFVDSPDYLNSSDGPAEWRAQKISVKVIDPPHPDFQGRQGIYSLSFNIPVRGTPLNWTIPFDAKAFTDPYRITWDGAMSVQVIWPHYATGITSAVFRGQLVTTKKTYNVVCHILVMSDQPTTYTVRFADDNYKIDNYQMSLVDLAQVFAANIQYGLAFQELVLPGIEHLLDELDINTRLDNSGFTLHKILSKLIVKELFAERKLTDIPAWNPFSSPFTLGLTALQVVVEDAYSTADRKIVARLRGAAHTSGGTDINLPFQFTVQFNPQQFRLYELALLPGIQDSLSVGRLLEVVGISTAFDLSSTFPGLSNLSNSLSISHVVVGWTSDPKPDNLQFSVSLDQWILAENIFEISQLNVDIDAKNLSSDVNREFALNGWGLIKIAEIDVEVFFAYNHSTSDVIPDQIYFQVGTQQRAIPLGKIILHLLGNETILPDQLSDILEETVMDNFIVKAEKAGGKWSVSKIQISMSVKGTIELLDNIDVAEPNLTVSIDNPFNKATRGIYVGISARVQIADVLCQTEFTIASAKSSIISMVFDAGQTPLTTEVLLTQFLGVDTIKLPSGLEFLIGIGIKRATLTLESTNGKFSVSEFTICAGSTTRLQLWNELSLDQVTLFVSRSRGGQNKVEFDAMLTLNKDFDFLTFSLLYEGPTAAAPSSNPGAVVTAGTPSGAIWSAMATYEGRLSVLDALSQVSGLQLRDILDQVDLPSLKEFLDIYITKLQIVLAHTSAKSSFSFDADLEWLCFSHLRFACSKSNIWAYSFGFATGSSSDNLIENIPILGPIIGAQVALEHMSVIVYNYELDSGALDPLLKIPPTSSGGTISLAIAARLQFKDVMKDLTKVVGLSSMDIVGTVSSSAVTLSAAIGTPITLFNGSMTLSGAVMVQCKKENQMLPQLGIEGFAKLDFGRHISEEPINISLWLLVSTADGGLGFKFTLDKWHGVFGFPGLNFDDVVFAATFPPQQFPIPSSFTIKGALSLSVNNAGIKGSVNVHFVEQNLMSSYATGSIEGLSLNTLIRVFAGAELDPPDYLDAGFGPLKFAFVPRDTVDESQKPLKEQYMMEGSFKLPFIHWDAAIKVDISPTLGKVSIDGHIDKIVVLNEKLFSILPGSEEKPPPPPDAGASIHVHVNDGMPFQAKASGKLTFLSLEKDLNFEVSQKGLEFLLAQDVWVNKGSLSGSVDNHHLAIAAAYEFSLDLLTPRFSIGSFEFETTRVIAFGAAFSLNVVWENIQWELMISGSFQLFSLKISKSFTIGASLTDLEAIGKQIAKWIVDTLAQDFLNGLKAILSSLKEVIKVLKETGLAMAEILKFLIKELGIAFEEAARAVQEFFGVAWETIVNILRDLGYLAKEIADGLEKVGVAVLDIATAIAKEWGEAVRNLCLTILNRPWVIVSDIVTFFRNVFHDPGQAIVDLLVSWGRGIISIFSAVGKVLLAPIKAVLGWIFGSRPKKTREQVQEELLLTLMVRINDLLEKPVEIQTEADLEVIMRRLTVQRFRRNFNYAFDGKTTKPPLSQNLQALTATENKCGYTDGQALHINEFRDRILSGFTFEPWMTAAATADLNEELQLLAGVVPSTYWQVSALKRTYHPASPEQNPVELNGIIAFVNGAHSYDGHNVTNTLSYYIGVYYEVPPPTQLARKSLRQQAFSRVPEANPPPVLDETSLSNALKAYSLKQFKNFFSFDYQQRPPGSQGASFYKSFNALSYFEDIDTKNIEPYISTKILSMAPLPDWVQGKALTDMASDYRQIITGTERGTWRNIRIDRSYTRMGESFNPVSCKGLIVYYTDTKTTDQRVTVSIAYIFFLGVYSETLNIKGVVRTDLIKALCDNLVKVMNNPESMPTLADKTRLTVLLGRYGRDEFYKHNGYELMDVATNPEKRVSGSPIHAIEQMGEFENWDDSKVASWVDSVLSAGVFPPVAKNSSIRQDMLDTVKYKLSGANDSGLNSWNVGDYDRSYDYDNENQNVRAVGMFIHCNGYLKTGDNAVRISFIHFSGVLYVEDNPW